MNSIKVIKFLITIVNLLIQIKYQLGTFHKHFRHDHHSKICSKNPETPFNAFFLCFNANQCTVRCNDGYEFPDKRTSLDLVCDRDQWSVSDLTFSIIPNCQPICEPSCKNNGICVSPNSCNCPDNYHGQYCENENKMCLNFPQMPLNSQRSCSSTSCTITCLDGYQFPDGSLIANAVCIEGNWVPVAPEQVQIPDCEPICKPNCENGGVCISKDLCQCSKDFRGSLCQYSIDKCSTKKMQFNGGFNCTGDSNSITCNLNCPTGIDFEFPPNDYYRCEYSKGIYEPQVIPNCVIPQGMSLIPIRINSGTDVINELKEQNKQIWIDYLNNWKKFRDQFYSINSTDFRPITYNEFRLNMTKEVIALPKPGICLTWSGLHYKTFDGQIFSIDSNCLHVLLKDITDESISIAVQNNKKCGKLIHNCSKIIKIIIDNKEYILKLNDENLPIFTLDNKRLSIPSRLSILNIDIIGLNTVINIDSLGLILKWDGKQMIQIKVGENLWNKTGGLCGSLDGNPKNDFVSKNGLFTHENINSFVEDWQIDKDNCDEVFDRRNHICDDLNNEHINEESLKFCHDLLTHNNFQECFKNVDPLKFIEACRWDYCSCNVNNRNNCICETANVYVKECLDLGFESVRNWRSENLCMLTCTNDRQYESCNKFGELTCETVNQISVRSEHLSHCQEGCFCPEGMVASINGTCINQGQCSCKYRGNEFHANTTIQKDCNTCTCNMGQWKCSKILCGSRCSVIGDPHYKTFDGYTYDFMGKCNYYLLKSNNYSIATENVACAGSISENMNIPTSIINDFPSCTKSVIIQINNRNLQLKQNFEVIYDNVQQIEKLPFITNEFSLRKASSMFLIVRLNNGLEIWWDGFSRVYLDAPANLRGTTQGLCGTFNENQKDDLLTPEGDIEQMIIPFANKWVTNEKCESVDEIKNNQHPCHLNSEKKKISEKHCKTIKSDLFSKCHMNVDPDIFYENCLYDLCSCETSIKDCLCPIIANYAKECVESGIMIDWRNEIRICGLHCDAGQVYDACGDSCKTSCIDISFFASVDIECPNSCAEGCHCPEGETLNENGECIPISSCPCEQYGLEFPPAYKLVNNFTKQLCTCKNAVWSCKNVNETDLEKFPNGLDTLKVICNEIDNEEFTTCQPEVPVTCRNMHEVTEAIKPEICKAGCQCKSGYVLESFSKKCIKPVDCSCHHGSRSYRENETVLIECNSCICRNGKWSCTETECSATCSVWGDSHYRTFDGKIYDFQGLCGYVFSKGILDDLKFEILIQNVLCGSFGITCSKSITLHIGNNNSITLDKGKSFDNRTINHSGISVRKIGLFISIEIEKWNFSLKWDEGTRLYLTLGPIWKNEVTGLCGNFNGNQIDDFLSSSGDIVEISKNLFADSWRLQSYCPAISEVNDICGWHQNRKIWSTKQCNVLKSKLFSKCHSEVEVQPFFDRCIFDTCACDSGGDCECLCTALAAYAFECNNRGVYLKWRSQKLCPIQCDTGLVYDPCIRNCPLETCNNFIYYKETLESCNYSICTEGCRPISCTTDKVFISESNMTCVDRSLCKSICVKFNNKIYYHDNIIYDNDNLCYCQNNEIICEVTSTTSYAVVGFKITQQTIMTSTEIINTVSIQNQFDQDFKCKTGWSLWYNENKPFKDVKYYIEREPIPKNICVEGKITKIECRTVFGKKNAKDSGNNADCNLQKGLKCISKTKACDDFEIRLFCHCSQNKTRLCDLLVPHVEHPDDCRSFYHCVPRSDGLNELIEKQCEFGTIFNPKTLICDWPDSVAKVKPECFDEKPINNFVNCSKICNYYLYNLQKEDKCTNNDTCENCFNSLIECPNNFLIEDFETCVPKENCSCVTKSGAIAQPETDIIEFSCEICKCTNNTYNCDISSCTGPQYVEKIKSTFPIQLSTQLSTIEDIIMTSISSKCLMPVCSVGYKAIQNYSISMTEQCPIFDCIQEKMPKKIFDSKMMNCSIVSCPPFENDTNYVYKLIKSDKECCYVQERVACNHNGVTYNINETWRSNTHKCKIYKCSLNQEQGKLMKQEAIELCRKNCPRGWTYELIENECCGQCIQKLCIFNNKTFEVNDSWTSEDSCTRYSCEETNDGSMFISAKEVLCPNIDEDCPSKNLDKVGCCFVCNRTDSMKNCLAYDIPENNTLQMIQENSLFHGLCTNMNSINGLKECKGVCDSKTIFDKGTNSFRTVCSCCRPINIKNILIELICQNGMKIHKKISAPQSCSCKRHSC